MSISTCGCTDVEIVGHDKTCGVILCVARTEYRDFIIAAFEGSDPCALENIDKDSVDFFLDMAESEFTSQELVFLRAYQSVCFNLMSCYAYQFDTLERFGESQSKTEGDSKTVGHKQLLGSGSTLTSDVQAMTARYNDYSRAAMDASANRTGCSHSDSYGLSTLDDMGEGAKKSRNRRRSILKASHDAQQHSETDNQSTDIGRGEGCDFSRAYSATAEDHTYAFIVSVAEIGKTSESTRSMINKYTNRGATVNSNQDWSIANTRKISIDGTRKDSVGQFQSNVTGTGKDQAKSDSTNIYEAQRTQKQRAEGTGFQRQSQDASTASLNETISKEEKEAKTRKTNTSWRFSTIKSYKNSQKYDTLKRLYDLLTEQISDGQDKIGFNCGPMSDAGNLQPFLSSANCGRTEITIQRILHRFPCLNCFGNYSYYY